MQRRNFLISLIFTLFSSCKFLKNPFATEEPEPIDDPWKYGGEIEIMYVRVLPIIYPNNPDPIGGASIYHTKYGGTNSSSWVLSGDNKWIASVSLNCDPQAYTISTGDSKVSLYPVGEKFFLRPKKEESNWVELKCIVPHPSRPNGTAAKFVFYNGQIQDPVPCS